MTIEAGHKDIKSLITGDNSQFHIPIYQRTYTWKAKFQVDKLIEDIIEFGREYKGNTKAEYYIGNIIVKNQVRAFQAERVVIDGQQRITTTILILCAIRDLYLNTVKTVEAKAAAKNIGRALFSENDGVIKLKLNNMEHQNTLITLLTGAIETISPSDKTTNYWENYQYIYKKLEAMGHQNLENFIDLLDRVKVVIIFLDDAQDENSVFESINSLGKSLSGSDLIKNFLFTFKNYLCSHSEEKLLIDIYTKNFESLFKNDEKSLETFFREYIALKTHYLVNKDPKVIYYSFKKMVGDICSFEDCKKLITDITKYGVIYQTLRVGSHDDIDQNHLEYLRPAFLGYSTLLMDIVDKSARVENGSIVVEEKSRLNEALKKVVAYDVCRLLAGLPTKQITRFIPTIPKKLELENKEYYLNYAKAFERLVTSTNEGYRQPNINILKRSVVDVDLYNRVQKQVLRFLVLMENLGKNEILSFERDMKGCEIEHIMPQALPPGWPISKENHERYLHTLGNLSITFDNQGLGNKNFNEKKEILIKKSRINLNRLLMKYDKFDESSIRDRSLSLLDMFVKAYEVNTAQDASIYDDSYNIEDDIFDVDDPTYIKLEYAVFLGEKLEIKDIHELYVCVISKLFKIYPMIFLNTEIGNRIKLTESLCKDKILNPVAINDKYFIESYFNNKHKFEIVKDSVTEVEKNFGFSVELKIRYTKLTELKELLSEFDF